MPSSHRSSWIRNNLWWNRNSISLNSQPRSRRTKNTSDSSTSEPSWNPSSRTGKQSTRRSGFKIRRKAQAWNPPSRPTGLSSFAARGWVSRKTPPGEECSRMSTGTRCRERSIASSARPLSKKTQSKFSGLYSWSSRKPESLTSTRAGCSLGQTEIHWNAPSSSRDSF